MFELLIATFLVVAAFLWHSTVRVLDLPAGSRTFRIILGLVLIGAMIYASSATSTRRRSSAG